MMKRDAGFSLIEMLIATAITLVVLALSASAFRSGLQTNQSLSLMAGTNQNLQTAAYYITQDLTKAGDDVPTNGVTIPNNAGQVIWPRPPVSPAAPGTLYYFPAGLVLNAVTTGDALGPLVMDTAASTVRSDVITVIYRDRTIAELPAQSVTVNAANTVVVIAAGSPINTTAANTVSPGDLFIFENANGTTVQEVTPGGSAGQTLTFGTNDVLKFNQPALAVGQGGIKTLVPNAPPPAIPPTTLRRLMMITYYIDRTTDVTVPRLVRAVNGRVGTPIALGVENLQFSYDSYINGVGALVNNNTPANPNAIRKVNIFLAARSEDKLTSTDNYVRNSLQTQVTVRSLGLFDVYPGISTP